MFVDEMADAEMIADRHDLSSSALREISSSRPSLPACGVEM